MHEKPIRDAWQHEAVPLLRGSADDQSLSCFDVGVLATSIDVEGLLLIRRHRRVLVVSKRSGRVRYERQKRREDRQLCFHFLFISAAQ